MKGLILLFLIVLGIFGIAFGYSGDEWYHSASFASGIVIVWLSGLEILDL